MPAEPLVIHNVLTSNFANLMIKYIYACKLQQRCPGSVLSNYFSEYWNIDFAPISQPGARVLEVRAEHQVDHERIAYLAGTGLVDRVNMHGHLQHMENLLPRDDCNALFLAPPETGVRFDNGYIVCPIRAGDILNMIHPDYCLLPVGFYQEVLGGFGLQPVFTGQTEPNSYTDALRAAFPSAIFLPTQGPLRDFETIRAARAIVVPISTFAWLAAWLSHATTIILPVFGLFNPAQSPGHDLLPLGDARYRFYKFPVQASVPLADVVDAHRSLSWTRVSDATLMRT